MGSDPIDGLEAYLEASTNMPHLLVLVLAFAAVIAISHGTIEVGRYAVKRKKKGLVLALIAAFGFATYLWYDSTFGMLILLAVALVATRRPIARLFARGKKRRHSEDA